LSISTSRTTTGADPRHVVEALDIRYFSPLDCNTHCRLRHARHAADNNRRITGEAEDELTVGTRTVHAIHGRLRTDETHFADEFVRSYTANTHTQCIKQHML